MASLDEEAWITNVALANSDEPTIDADWRDWLHEVFTSRGPIDALALRELSQTSLRDLAEQACELAAVDVLETTGKPIAATAIINEWGVCVVVNGITIRSGLFSIGFPELTVEVADTIQGEVMEKDGYLVWPECDSHNAGLHPELAAGRATWVCRVGNHAVADIGRLHRDSGRHRKSKSRKR